MMNMLLLVVFISVVAWCYFAPAKVNYCSIGWTYQVIDFQENGIKLKVISGISGGYGWIHYVHPNSPYFDYVACRNILKVGNYYTVKRKTNGTLYFELLEHAKPTMSLQMIP